MIEAQSLCRYYEGDVRVAAVRDVTFRVAAGERVSIVGRSGSGKTTLINLLAGLDSASDGLLKVDDQIVSQLDRRQMAAYRLQTVGIVFQSFQLIPHRTALQNIELPLILAGISRPERQERAAHQLETVGLAHRAGHFPWQLSGGEQQRVAIARSIIQAPPVLLADEPTGNLDSNTAANVMEVLLNACDANRMTLVLVTHDESLARTCATRCVAMHDGELREVGNI